MTPTNDAPIRLVVMLNSMVLSEINPKDVYDWFMEFACDSYDYLLHLELAF